jgi:hypothetical protein
LLHHNHFAFALLAADVLCIASLRLTMSEMLRLPAPGQRCWRLSPLRLSRRMGYCRRATPLRYVAWKR